MAEFRIEGGNRLEGEVALSGAKNAALPILCGSLLSSGIVELENIPTDLVDIKVTIELLKQLGAVVSVDQDKVRIDPSGVNDPLVPMELASRIRSSLILLGILMARFGRVEIPFPGGCNIGERKFDLHLEGLRRLGARIDCDDSGIRGEVGMFRGADVEFYLPSTTGTQNVMLAAVLAEGKTTIRNANTRPENADFARFLISMGAKIRVSKRFIEIEGVEKLDGTRYKVMKGRDEAMTFMVAAGITGGEISIRDFDLKQLRADTHYLREAGVEVCEKGSSVVVSGRKGVQPFDVFTAPYPGVNSDIQPFFAVLALKAKGISSITDQRFTDRFKYVDELRLLGAHIERYGNCAIVHGGNELEGTRIRATDIRGGAAAVLAGLIATGTTIVDDIHLIDRGYERFDLKLGKLGAQIERN